MPVLPHGGQRVRQRELAADGLSYLRHRVLAVEVGEHHAAPPAGHQEVPVLGDEKNPVISGDVGDEICFQSRAFHSHILTNNGQKNCG